MEQISIKIEPIDSDQNDEDCANLESPDIVNKIEEIVNLKTDHEPDAVYIKQETITEHGVQVKIENIETQEYNLTEPGNIFEPSIIIKEDCNNSGKNTHSKNGYNYIPNNLNRSEHSAPSFNDKPTDLDFKNSGILSNGTTISYSELINDMTDNQSITCPICNDLFVEMHLFKQHIKTTHPEKLTCFICNRSFASNGHLLSHVNAMHSGDVACPTCGKIYSNRTKLGRHKLKKHRDKQELFICDMCKKTFNQKYNLMRHISLMHPQNSIKCTQCVNTFKNERLLKKHMVWYHPVETTVFKCYVCNKILHTKEAHDKHLQVSHQWFSMGQCDICNKVCMNKKGLAQHMKTKHNATQTRKPGKFCCEKCGKKFRTTTSLHWHTRQYHTEELKDRVCPVCTKQYLDNYSLRCHLETVHSLEKAKCDVCKKSFKSETYLKRHVRETHTETPKIVKKVIKKLVDIPCTMCTKIYNSKQDLAFHMMSDHNENSVCCPFCKKHYSTKKTLHHHVQRMHRNEKSTSKPCPLCGKVLRSSLIRHMMKMHEAERHNFIIQNKDFTS